MARTPTYVTENEFNKKLKELTKEITTLTKKVEKLTASTQKKPSKSKSSSLSCVN
jgi:hypothetical protein